jgi:multidrug efflux pump subunit AcrA (membrane-fusion protein)
MIKKIIDYFNKLNPLNIFILILILGLVYGGVSLYSKYLGFSKVMNKTKITTVKAIPVTIGTAQKTYRALSTIESFESIEITSKVNGIIEDIFFKEGSNVKLGDKLFSILSSDMIGRTQITAPFDGIIGLNKKNIGDQISKSEILTFLDNYRQMKLEFDLPEKILGYLNKKLSFTAFSENLPNMSYTGTLDYIDTRIDRATRTIRVYALIDNYDNLLKPGLLMKVDLLLEEKDNSILMPEEALLSINKKHYVYTVENNVAKIQEISIGIRNKAMIEVTKGLKHGDKVIFMGQEKLKNGSKIKILE